MTEQDKVTVDDIIGIVKTEEPTDSVEEVRKLRGRENKTAKRFTLFEDLDILDNNTGRIIPPCLDKGLSELVDLLNQLNEENEQLKRKMEKVYNSLVDENEQLKNIIDQLRTDNTKQKKKLNTTMKENEHIKQTIKDMMENERTEIGKMTLRQLWRQIQ